VGVVAKDVCGGGSWGQFERVEAGSMRLGRLRWAGGTASLSLSWHSSCLGSALLARQPCTAPNQLNRGGTLCTLAAVPPLGACA